MAAKLPKRKRGGQNREIKTLYKYHEALEKITEENVELLPKLHQRLKMIALGEIDGSPISSQVTCIKELMAMAESRANAIEEAEFGEEDKGSKKDSVTTSQDEGSNIIKMEM